MALLLAKTVIDYLKAHPEQKFSAREIADWVFAAFPDECQAKKQSSTHITTDNELRQQLVREIIARRLQLQKNCSQIKTTEGRPRKYYYSEKSDSDEVEAAEEAGMTESTDIAGTQKTTEHDLYPMLAAYVWEEFGVYSKRINEKRSSNRHGSNGNRWLYPDVVGMEDLGADWTPEVRDCVDQHSDKRIRLWSFEAKLLINRSNVRECFFQAVSNSSWANFGYLVAAEIEGQGTLKELRMLFAAHGIGLIKLDTEAPADSQILIPARERAEIHWDTANRLVTENKDFSAYIKLVKQFYQTGEARLTDWDVPEVVE
jgi:hypothetical protein